MENIYKLCSQCGGSGEQSVTTFVGEEETTKLITCLTCDGDGRLSRMSLDQDLIDLFKDMYDKIKDIKEKVDEIKEK